MRYSDWALGQFFDKARKAPYFRETLFVIVGDHGFGSGPQLTEMNLARFNVPLLLIAPGVQEKFGERSDTVGTQVDIVPTIMGRLGGEVRHQCWGRDLLNLPEHDKGFGVIKPSGNDQTVAIIRDDKILVKSRSLGEKAYAYQLWTAPRAIELNEAGLADELGRALDAYLQVATGSLLDNSTGTRPEGRQKISGR
jgi:phosphoglycerol transferase MdoB-like AlkP superfamily enzyme